MWNEVFNKSGKITKFDDHDELTMTFMIPKDFTWDSYDYLLQLFDEICKIKEIQEAARKHILGKWLPQSSIAKARKNGS